MKLKRILKYLMLLILLSSLAFVYGFSNLKNSGRSIDKIQVDFELGEGHFLSSAMVNKLLIQNDSSVQNQAKSVIDLYRLEEQVAENPYIEKASLFITIDGTLHSLIKERTPIARIIGGDKTYYLDTQGVEVPLSEKYSARVPVVTGLRSDKDVEKIRSLVTALRSDDFLNKEITGIHMTNSSECIFTVRSGDYQIEFGELTQVKDKFRKLKAFYNKAYLDSSIHKYKTINIKYHNQVVGVK